MVFLLFVLGLTLPFEGIITPLYYQVRDIGLLNTRWAIILPLIGLFMPFCRLLDARALRQHARGAVGGGADRRRRHCGSCSGASTCRWPMPAISSLAILLFLWTWNQFLLAIVLVDDPHEADDGRRPGRLPGPVGRPTSRCCAPARC